ncbi:MAG: LysM peptidoglycan-binding domain-containing protein [Elusimicrobia bacterium]|nr:LysM peptidoglycan-binding domain-containing protein [Elusimicrobiota bacterium]
MRRFIVAIAFILAWTGPCPAGAAGPGSPEVRRSGFVMDGKGLPLTGTFLLDFRFRDPAGRGELWRESIYVEAVEGVFHADLGKVRPLPRSQSVTGDMVEVSAPAGSGWVVRTMVAVPASRQAPAAKGPPEGAAASREILQLQKELQKAKAEIEEQKNAVRPAVYEVQPGDTLRSIAEKVFGNAEQWVDLYQANDDRLLRGGDLVPGQKLIIPRDVPGANRRQ